MNDEPAERQIPSGRRIARRMVGIIAFWLALSVGVLVYRSVSGKNVASGTSTPQPGAPTEVGRSSDGRPGPIDAGLEDADGRDAQRLLRADPNHDFFPDKATIRETAAFSVTYHGTYKVVTVPDATLPDTVPPRVYVLVQRGCPTPAGYDGATMVQIPVRRIATTAQPFLAHIELLDLGESLVAHSHLEWATPPGVRARIDAERVAEIRGADGDAGVNLEKLLLAKPDLVLVNTPGYGSDVSLDPLARSGLKVAYIGDYLETSPLGRAEWIKFLAFFTNRERVAGEVFDGIATRYRALAERARLAADGPDAQTPGSGRPTVLVGAPWQGTWYVPGGRSHVARQIADAGGAYPWADEPSAGSQALQVETVFARAGTADVWINPGTWTSREGALMQDNRFGKFAAFANARVYNNDAMTTPTGANDYWCGAYAEPDRLLADLVAILHPDLLPDHQLVWYRRLP